MPRERSPASSARLTRLLTRSGRTAARTRASIAMTLRPPAAGQHPYRERHRSQQAGDPARGPAPWLVGELDPMGSRRDADPAQQVVDTLERYLAAVDRRAPAVQERVGG